jgi:hypothetical protein
MKVFHCDHCDQLLFFENVECVNCHHTLAYVPELGVVTSLDPADNGTFTSPLKRAQGKKYKLCSNYTTHNVCNWALDANDPHALCLSCRLTRTIPDLSNPANKTPWYKLEIAKRRLVYTLAGLELPLKNKTDDPQCGLTFEFLADPDPSIAGAKPVLTGHDDGVIVLNLAEADDAEREKRRLQLHEPYRTLLGHFRHEVGHYYWDRLIRDGKWLQPFRELFGDESQDYAQALQKHYSQGAPPDWQMSFVSTYATSHPWEDWAETWAHYLHMADTLETAADCGVTIRPSRRDEPAMKAAPDVVADDSVPFDKMMRSWFPLTYMLNNLNRGMGLPDAYPFILSDPAVKKLRFVHDVIAAEKR